jgi:hypothetical protein
VDRDEILRVLRAFETSGLEYPAIRCYPPTGDLYFDVLTRLGESARFETVEAEIKDIAGIRVRVATPAALYRMKKGTVREKVSSGRRRAAGAVRL